MSQPFYHIKKDTRTHVQWGTSIVKNDEIGPNSYSYITKKHLKAMKIIKYRDSYQVIYDLIVLISVPKNNLSKNLMTKYHYK